MSVEHAQHAVDLGRDLLAERVDARHVLLEHHRRRELAARIADALEEALRIGEQLLRRQRDLLPAHDVLVEELEPRLGPQQELMERGLTVDQADLRGGHLAVKEPDLAAPQAADQGEHRAAPERRQRAHEREHARGLGERADEVVPRGRRLAAQQAPDRHDIPEERRQEDDLVRPRGLGVGPAHTAAGEHDRDVELGLVEDEPGLAQEVEGTAIGAADDHQPGVRGRDLEPGPIDLAERRKYALPRESELDLPASPRVGVEDDDFRGSRHAAVAT